MKLLVFAHTPPPHHGQSLAVQRMLEGFGGEALASGDLAGGAAAAGLGIRCYHVNARLSADLEDLGQARWGKVPRLIGYCARAVWLRFRRGATALYYVPAPPKRNTLYRDWLVMLLCRPFFRHVIFHWHAVGLGDWLTREGRGWEQRLSRWLLGRADLAIVLSSLNRTDAEWFRPRRVAVVANGIPDPCPDYAQTVERRRLSRVAARQKLLEAGCLSPQETEAAGPEPGTVRVLYLAHCTRDKGLLDTLEGARLAREQLEARGSRLRLSLTVIGDFVTPEDRWEFDRWLAAPGAGDWLRYLGFVSVAAKWAALREADLFCFPTWFAYEGQPANLIEAMAFGLPILTTRWRGIPELLPPDYGGLVEPRQPAQLAAALLGLLTETGQTLRDTFVSRFVLNTHLAALAEAIHSAGSGVPRGAPPR